ncbi:MAG TPA: GNAT family N-acetyltransferase [Clostridia bacterium]|nr:GNAT family N-acetyltransferase [Clostridia bacterium]HRX41485.1 GNAT family N-acetyltransferase [Clostridia bacterium]
MTEIRTAREDDIAFMMKLEEVSFPKSRRSSAWSIKHSLNNHAQLALIAENDGIRAGSAIIRLHKKSIRIYSIAVSEDMRGMSIGKKMMQYIIDLAKESNMTRILLEADSSDTRLLDWYRSLGFSDERLFEDYYGPGEHALRMVIFLKESEHAVFRSKKRNVVVIDSRLEYLDDIPDLEIIHADEFLSGDSYQSSSGIRVFNLCQSYEYQSMGYYVSLLAAARDQRVIPNVTTIKDFSDSRIIRSIGEEVHRIIQEELAGITEKEFGIRVFFGQSCDGTKARLGRALYRLFESPFLEFTFKKGMEWRLWAVRAIAPEESVQIPNIRNLAVKYFSQKRFSISRFRDYKYDMAILIDPDEKNPPSDIKALSEFKTAAEDIGFFVDFIYREDYPRLGEYDALFIRCTTNVNDYTYQFSRYAYAEGLVVIDDPWSILKCSNKLFLSERMRTGAVNTPRTVILGRESIFDPEESGFGYPVILKKPDSAFSMGVHKAGNREEFDRLTEVLFESSDLIMLQEYIKSDFDWRIGVLDNRAIYACKYFMAVNHWQIYNWKEDGHDNFSGGFETVDIAEVPVKVLKTALKATALIGDGLYGVDLKESNGKVYVIEVNDNPSIEYGIEDKIAGTGLYHSIMQSIYNRIEDSRSAKRLVSNL